MTSCSTMTKKKVEIAIPEIVENITLPPIEYNDEYQTLIYSSPRWRETSLPITIIAPRSMRKTLKKHLSSVCKTFNSAVNRVVVKYNFENYDPNFTDDQGTVDGKIRIYFAKEWWKASSDSGQVAVTLFYVGNNVMKEADIIFNLNFKNSYETKKINKDSYDFQTVLLHEVGHVLGFIGHNYEDGSIMYPSVNIGLIKRNLTIFDKYLFYNKYKNEKTESNESDVTSK